MNYIEVGWRWEVLLGAALREGLLEAVAEERKDPARLAADLDLDGRAVYTVMSALAEFGVLDESNEGYRLVEEHRGPLLDVDHPSYAGGRVVHNFELIAKWATMPDILHTGEPAEDRTVPDFDGTATMARAMRAGSKESADEVTGIVLPRLLRSSKALRILDVGGGSGANSESFARSGASVTILDRPEVFEVNGGYFVEAGIAMVPGDINEGLPEGPFDCVYLGNTSHMYGPEENERLFERMFESLASGGYVAIREFVRGVESKGDVPGEAALFAVNMLVLTSRGATYTTAEYEEWLARAGFADVEFIPIPGRTTALILARKPR
ncbi:MAG: methyltransferase [Rubrobacter sp.]